jgi:hypothetical protein
LFERTFPASMTPAWSYASYVPDAFILTTSNLDIDTPDPALTNAYLAFTTQIRAAYPAAHIFVVVTSYATDNYPVGKMVRTRFSAVANAVASARTAAGDTKVYAYAMTEYTEAQLTGCDYHPGPALHAQMAGELTSWLRTRLGW